METKNQMKELEEKIILKALKDSTFREQLLKDPKGAIGQELGIVLPDHLSVKIVEEKENEVYLVIPQNVQQEDEITQLELESVSGGWSGGTCDCKPSCCTITGG